MTDPTRTDLITLLMQEFARANIRELHIRQGDFELYLSTDPAASHYQPAAVLSIASTQSPAPARVVPPSGAAPKAAAPVGARTALPDDAIIISAPNLGTFYRAPKPGTANYVEVGSKVQAGDELCLIEVMKLFTALCVEEAGTIHAVLVEDGAMVEGGQPLFALVRD